MRGGRLSYRWRRRIVAASVAAVVVGGVAAAVVFVPGTRHAPPSATQTEAEARAVTPATTEAPRRTNLRPSAAERKRILSTISLFISTAVSRHHPERSFDIVDASMRQGMTKREWAKGSIPVVPFPASAVDLVQFQLYSGDSAMVEVLLEPARGSHLLRKTFQINLHRNPAHRWLVSYWIPEGVSQSSGDFRKPDSPDIVAKAANPPHLSAKWIYVPLGILLLGLLVTPVVVFGRHAYVARRATKRYRESLPPDDARRYEPWR